jgi:ATP-dependent DNA ligase
MPLPRFVEPQLSKLLEKAPTGPQWVHEIKFDGFRMAARIERGKVQLLTRSGLDWTAKYPATAAAFSKLPVKTAYIDGELCGVRADGVTSFELMQQSSDAGYGGLVHFAFDLLELDGENVARLPLLQRKERLAQLLNTLRRGSSTASMRAATVRLFARRLAGPRGSAGSGEQTVKPPSCPSMARRFPQKWRFGRASATIARWWAREEGGEWHAGYHGVRQIGVSA